MGTTLVHPSTGGEKAMNRWTVFLTILLGTALDAVAGTLSGVITDPEGRPQPGIEVYLYRGESIRRPADYISGRTAPDGRYRLTVPKGDYWVIARERREGDERFGPLPLDRRHSGEPLFLAIDGDDTEITQDFTVFFLREAAALKRREKSHLVTRTVRIIDRSGMPVAGALAYATSHGSKRLIPDFISPSSDREGVTSLSLPAGTYRVGATTTFPPQRVSPTLTLSTDSTLPVTITLDPQ